MQFKKFKLSAIYTAIFMQLSVSTLGMPIVAQASTQQDMKVQSTVLKAGESVADVAKRNKVSVDHLWEINSFAFSDKATFLAASAGQAIWIPAGKAAALPLERATQQDTKANKSAQQADVKVNDKTTDARQFGQNQLNSMAGQQAESWLNGFGGSSRVSISSDKNFSNYNYAGDVLVPLWDSRDFMIFSQLGARHADERTTGNIGFGSRYFVDGWMLGNNVFFDNDFSGNNRRIGLGAEIWTEALRLAANGYYGLNGWHQSKLLADHDERPANGWDIELASWLPMYPQLGGKVKYEQFYGDNVALMSRSNLQKNPSAVTMGVNWTPVPLVTVDAGHRKSMQSGGDTTVGLNLNWNFGQSLDWHLSPEAVADQRSLVGSRYELVSRNNEIVMDYREQTVITFSLASAIKGVEGTSQPLGVSVWAKHGLGKIVWDDAALVAAGGKITGTGANSALVLPAYKDGANNSYTLSAVAYDSKGKASPRAQVQITVEKTEQIPEQPGQPDAGQTTLTLINGQLVANGTSKTELVVELKDKDGKLISGNAGNLRLDAQMQNKLTRAANSGVTVGKFREEGSGRYVVDLTAGTEAGVVMLTMYHGSTQLGHLELTLKAKGSDAGDVAQINFTSIENQFVAGQSFTYTVIATDSEGKPVSGAALEFNDREGNAIIADNGGITDAEGKVSLTLMKEKAQHYNIAIRVAGSDKYLVDKPYMVMADVASAQVAQSEITAGKFKTNNGVVQMITPATFTAIVQDRFQNPLIYQTVVFEAEQNGNQIKITANGAGKTNEHGEVSGTVTLQVPVEETTVTYNLYAMIDGKRVEGNVKPVTMERVASEPATIRFENNDQVFVVGSEVNFPVVVTDSFDIPVPDVTVEFFNQANNIIDRVKTNAQGQASTTMRMPEKESVGTNLILGVRVQDHSKVMQQRPYMAIADMASARVVSGESTQGTYRGVGTAGVETVTPATFAIALEDRFQNALINKTVTVVAEPRSDILPTITIVNNKTNGDGVVIGEATLSGHTQSSNAYYDLYVMIDGKRLDGPSTTMEFTNVN
ncbi:inverse autotransporter beta domain-containing protein [Pantoea phytobeneficialis]|uniref:Inverse autotransporter beta domain-containing protein n=1 Tax=Pantoea phytobeneficialis TaxID=2052056 RepID=A0AAP9KQ73_9GAMM|nr:inverse autotransporter beta domain-containing protein [Pantoea phytobeneficialis]MDO6405089.1 inverse autotransporter beta domain-containing protein [Pantoea phytobeneficialis]QGR07618.1 hypothetical protein CTZ24_14820 [Pantoea phytobeneficialis]